MGVALFACVSMNCVYINEMMDNMDLGYIYCTVYLSRHLGRVENGCSYSVENDLSQQEICRYKFTLFSYTRSVGKG